MRSFVPALLICSLSSTYGFSVIAPRLNCHCSPEHSSTSIAASVSRGSSSFGESASGVHPKTSSPVQGTAPSPNFTELRAKSEDDETSVTEDGAVSVPADIDGRPVDLTSWLDSFKEN